MVVDAHTPAVVGAGQAAERIDDAHYRGMSAVELAAAAARAALEDCVADPAKVAASTDAIAGVRQFEISGPAEAVLGKSNNYPRSVANRLGADPSRGELVGIPAEPDAQADSPTREVIAGRDRFRQRDRIMLNRQRHRGGQPDPRGDRTRRTEADPGVQRAQVAVVGQRLVTGRRMGGLALDRDVGVLGYVEARVRRSSGT